MQGSSPRTGPSEIAASAYLRHRRKEFELALRRKFGRNDLEAQENLISGSSEMPFNDEELEGLKGTWFSFSLWTRLVLIVAAAALAVNLFIMIGLESYVSSMTGSLTAFMVGVAQLRLEDLETLREVHNRMRKDVNAFFMENVRLGVSVNELTLEVQRLASMEPKLTELARREDSSSQSLVALIRDNRDTLHEMKKVVRNEIVTELMSAVFKGERDQSGQFSEVEIKRFLQYMRGLPAVTINEDLLMRAIHKDRSITSLLALVRDIGVVGVQEGDRIFVINEEDRDLQTRFIETPEES